MSADPRMQNSVAPPPPGFPWRILAAVLLLIAAALPWLEGLGTRLYHQSVVQSQTRTFLQAIIDGDRNRALALLDDAQQRALADEVDHGPEGFWSPDRATKFSVLQTIVRGREASAVVSLWRDGFAVKPTIHWHQDQQGQWRIESIDHVDEDPRWEKMQEYDATRDDRGLADELARELNARRQ